MTSRPRPPRAGRAAAGTLALALAAGGASAAAQEVPEFNMLRTPISPAFVILGITPAEIERPNRPGAFAASFLQRVEDAARGRGLPAGYAVEVAPYWLRSHPGLTFREYARGGVTSLYRDASLSFAVTDSLGDGEGAPEDDASFRRLGFGVRTTLRPGRLAPNAIACADTLAAAGAAVAGDIARAIVSDPELVRLRRELATDPTKVDSIRLLAGRVQERILTPEQERLSERAKVCTERLSARHGLTIDAALAGAVDFAGGRANAGDFRRFGAWLTPAWLGESFSHIGVLRLSVDHAGDAGRVRLYDAGLRSVYAWQRFAASAELVVRRVAGAGEAETFTRAVAIFDAKVTREAWLTLSAGRDFDPGERNSLLALVGLKWQLGEQRVKPDIPLAALP